jgi:hypothetical protein
VRDQFILKCIKAMHPIVKLNIYGTNHLLKYHEYISNLPAIMFNEETMFQTKMCERHIANHVKHLVVMKLSLGVGIRVAELAIGHNLSEDAINVVQSLPDVFHLWR